MRRLRTRLALERNVLVLAGTVLLILAWMFTWYQLLPMHLRDLGASDEQVGLSYSLMNLGYALMQLLGGLLADRHGRKWLIVLPTPGFVPLYLRGHRHPSRPSPAQRDGELQGTVNRLSRLSPVSRLSRLSPVSRLSRLSPVSRLSRLSPVSRLSRLS